MYAIFNDIISMTNKINDNVLDTYIHLNKYLKLCCFVMGTK